MEEAHDEGASDAAASARRTLDASELEDFRQGVTRLLGERWPSARCAQYGDLKKLWTAVIEAGWLEAATMDSLSVVIVAARELGAVACPLPIMDAFVAARLFPHLVDHIAVGRIRPVAALDRGKALLRHVEAAQGATHVLVIKDRSSVELRAIERTERTPGMAIPDWCSVGPAERCVAATDDAERVLDAVLLLRLGRAASAWGAAARAHALAVEHACVRRQFGRVIGAFGAVQQRTAACQIDVDACSLLIDQAVGLYERKSPEWTLASVIACTHASASTRRVQLGAHHTLAASGFFEEHEAPWLFRRVHADVAMLDAMEGPGESLGDLLVEGSSSLPDLQSSESAAQFRARVRAVLDALNVEPPLPGLAAADERVVKALAEHALLGCGWPRELGGMEASAEEQVALMEELHYRRLHVWQAIGAVMMLGEGIMRHGSAEQKARFLPMIRRGELRFCLGYSEPGAGSDLASLRTRATRDGDDWIIEGQKLWTSGADLADWVWLAVRTDPQASPPHAGITVFLVPLDTPGISMQEHRALSGAISFTVTYDKVRIPDSARVGEVNEGWKVITAALAGERIIMGGTAATLHRQLDELLKLMRADPELAGPRGSWRRAQLGRLAADVQATRALVVAGAKAAGTSASARLRAPEAKVMGGETAEALAEAAVDILGPEALVGSGELGPPTAGAFDYHLRVSPMYVIGGGTNDVLRGQIARALGLPKG